MANFQARESDKCDTNPIVYNVMPARASQAACAWKSWIDLPMCKPRSGAGREPVPPISQAEQSEQRLLLL